LNELIDLFGANEDHPMYEYLDTLGTLIHTYEETNYGGFRTSPQKGSIQSSDILPIRNSGGV
jgi:hypothetical protein